MVVIYHDVLMPYLFMVHELFGKLLAVLLAEAVMSMGWKQHEKGEENGNGAVRYMCRIRNDAQIINDN